MGNSTDQTIPNPFEHMVEAVVEQMTARMEAMFRPQAELPRWMTRDEAIEYSRLPEGTFNKLAQARVIPCHGGKTKVFDRLEVDRALLAL